MCQRGVPQGLLERFAPQRLEMCVTTRTTAWAGIDIGKTHHWICAVDAAGRALVSVKVANVEADIVAALATVSDLADPVAWAVDIVGAPSSLILAFVGSSGKPGVPRVRAGGEHDERRLHR
jgi:hypothetical protein